MFSMAGRMHDGMRKSILDKTLERSLKTGKNTKLQVRREWHKRTGKTANGAVGSGMLILMLTCSRKCHVDF